MRLAVVATSADLVTFLGMLALLGPAAEQNPLVRAAIAAGLLVAVIGAKVAVIVVLAAWPRAVGRWSGPVGACAAAVGVLGAASNLRAVS